MAMSSCGGVFVVGMGGCGAATRVGLMRAGRFCSWRGTMVVAKTKYFVSELGPISPIVVSESAWELWSHSRGIF